MKNEEKGQDLPSYQANNITGFQDPVEDKYQDINQALEEVELSVSNDSRDFSELIKSNSNLKETKKKLLDEVLKLKKDHQWIWRDGQWELLLDTWI